MISWSDIDSEVEEFQSGYKSGFVSIFKKYEGQETDERTEQNKVVKVTSAGFAARYGIRDATFRDWVKKEEGTEGVVHPSSNRYAKHMDKVAEEAAAKATAEAVAKADKALAAQEAKAAAEFKRLAEETHRAKQAALLEAARTQKAAVEAERIRAKAEAEEANAKKLSEIEVRLRAEIKAEPPTPEVLAAMASQALTSSDPNIVQKMADAYGQHRVEQDKRAQASARERSAASRAAAAERDAQNAERRASLEYEDSALKLIVDAHEILKDANTLMGRKAITFSNVVASGLTVGEVEDMIEEGTEILKRAEAQTLDATVENVRTT